MEDLNNRTELQPIISQEHLDGLQEWVTQTVHYLLHQAPQEIERCLELKDESNEEQITYEMAERIICARLTVRLVERVYATHDSPLEILWWAYYHTLLNQISRPTGQRSRRGGSTAEEGMTVAALRIILGEDRLPPKAAD
jgi:hypothetical protein